LADIFTKEPQHMIAVLLETYRRTRSTGFQLANAVQSLFPDVIVLLMSGGLIENFPPDCIPHHFFQKPFSYQELLTVIAPTVRRSPPGPQTLRA
jgi:hypothetical protein